MSFKKIHWSPPFSTFNRELVRLSKADGIDLIYFFIVGIFGVIKQLLHLSARVRQTEEERHEENLRQSPTQTLLNCFMLGWFIIGKSNLLKGTVSEILPFLLLLFENRVLHCICIIFLDVEYTKISHNLQVKIILNQYFLLENETK